MIPPMETLDKTDILILKALQENGVEIAAAGTFLK